MNHEHTTLASDDEHDLALERCSCGQYALSVGPVTIQVEPAALEALVRMLVDTVEPSDGAPPLINTPDTGDVH